MDTGTSAIQLLHAGSSKQQIKHQISGLLTFCESLVDSPHKGPVAQKAF